MANVSKGKRTAKKIIIAVITVLLLFIIFSACNIYNYLRRYGYGAKELPRTMAVFLGLSDGFTVGETEYGTEHMNIFIGRHDYIYDDLFEKNGFYQSDRMGIVGYYNKSGDENDPRDFIIVMTGDWCTFFRVYEISADYRIEDFS